MTRGFLRFLRGNTIALLALFLALGGTTYAAVSLPKNSVGTKQLKKNAVTPAKIKKSAVTNAKIGASAVTGAKVKDDSLTGADVNESTLGAVPSATNATNATNAANAASAANATALNGFAANAIVRTAFTSANPAVPVPVPGPPDTTLLTTTITAPGSGFLLIDVDDSFNATAATPVIHCGVDVDNAGAWQATFSQSQGVTLASGFGVCGKATRLAVAAGAHTVRFKAHNDGTGTLQSYGGSMTVRFVPFGSTGGTATGAPTTGQSKAGPTHGDVLKG
jgi:hypothetical protein